MSIVRAAAAGILTWSAAALVSPLMVPATRLEALRAQDLHALRQAWGDAAAQRMQGFAACAREFLPHEPGLRVSRAEVLPPSRLGVPLSPSFLAEDVATRSASLVGVRWRHGLRRQCELSAIRLGIAGTWLAALGPLLLAAAYDGSMQRRLRHARQLATPATAFSVSGIALSALVAIPLLLVTVPLPWPHGWMPAWAIATSLALAIRMSLGRPSVFR